jgi:hypothetical protein
MTVIDTYLTFLIVIVRRKYVIEYLPTKTKKERGRKKEPRENPCHSFDNVIIVV